jgi:hypothetical protein
VEVTLETGRRMLVRRMLGIGVIDSPGSCNGILVNPVAKSMAFNHMRLYIEGLYAQDNAVFVATDMGL